MPVTSSMPKVPPKAPSATRRRRWWPLLALLVVVSIMATALVLLFAGEDEERQQDGQRATGQAQTLPGGLRQGDATVTFERCTDDVAGVARGCEHSEAGAVEAAAAAMEFVQLGGSDMTPVERAQLEASVWAEGYESMPEGLMRRSSRVLGLDSDTGRLLNGEPGEEYINECWPEFGAYKVTRASSAAVDVALWMPCAYGAGAPDNTDDVRLRWAVQQTRLIWQAGDWRLRLPAEQPDITGGPTPSKELRPNVSIEERGDLLAAKGGGWSVFDGWSEKYPTATLGKEPE